ncbi:hypothetical protein [Actinacidiphila sp. ITFR-21]|uniref:hypothetical protein n=1 Tax=Actinacidiphila sp. ITFR-21 TaxID=3075199 RepID=UPI002889373D|nr:hypothetical protein [Streptomyces sp. ITFR-21]WNI14076.1 hypothetical protein RLT57_00055 [Streptomyces sp. ITFR-21]WNI19474.1 hypothetical protein RLT57_30635 [Streptomyces sp. ITFR-21]
MDSWEGLWVNNMQVSRLRDGLDNILLAAFTDDMLTVESVSITDPQASADVVHDVYSLCGQGRAISRRLSLLGITPDAARGRLEQALRESESPIFPIGVTLEPTTEETAERRFLKGYGAADWIRDFRKPPAETTDTSAFGEQSWLLKQLRDLHPVDALQVALLALPDSTVVMYVAETDGDPDSDLLRLCSKTVDEMHATALEQAPVVVLTEGSSDVAILEPALELLYPHLTDLVRFMDYGVGAQGGAGSLVTTVLAFASAGIANPVVALFDNDTAASDALRRLRGRELPENIKVLQYPRLEIAENYPTLGPPTTDAPKGQPSYADVNGLAGSIEIYLGRDVLELDGALRPVQWGNYSPGSQQYQGEITGKTAVQTAYAGKLRAAQKDHSLTETQDWSGIRAILDMVISAFE